MSNTRYWIGFNHVKGIGTSRLRGLWAYFQQDMARAWQADPAELRRAGLDEKTLNLFLEHRRTFDLDNALAKLDYFGAWACTLDDPRYPHLLTQIPDAPPLLYIKGDLLPDDTQALAIVGTRKATQYGHMVTERIATVLAQAGVTIISGLARGLDASAHLAALKSGGRTLAVLGNGIDMVYPPENKRLAEEMVQNGQGALITEYPLGTTPNAAHFPARNRIISGLALGVLVIEAPEGSGALLTANCATEQGREVFAIPGNINAPNSRGTNRLIQEGAKLVMSPQDILVELRIQHQTTQTRQVVERIAPDNPAEARLLGLIEREPLHVDELAIQTGQLVHEVSALLMVMKLKGMVEETAPMMYMAVQL